MADKASLASYRCMATRPERFVPRRQLDDLVILLRAAPHSQASAATVGITTALHGAGGFGKTTLAQALCFDARVREAFGDGILWVTLGEEPGEADLLGHVQDLIRWTGNTPTGYSDLARASAELREHLAGKRVLLVVDDVWRPGDLVPFLGLHAGAAVLCTTRDQHTLPRGSRKSLVDAMAPGESAALLGHDLDAGARSEASNVLAELAGKLGCWPFLLDLVQRELDALIGDGMTVREAVAEAERLLAEQGMTAFDVADDRARRATVAKTLAVSARRLDALDRERYEMLAVFPEDVDIPLAVVARLWNVPEGDARKLCVRLYERSMLQRFDRVARTLRLHDVVRRHLRDLRRENLARLHGKWLAAFRPPSGRWCDLPADEPHAWRHLAYHLAGAGRMDELARLLLDFAWLDSKLRATSTADLVADFALLDCEHPAAREVRLVREALRLSSHVLASDPGQFSSQLVGRLVDLATQHVGIRLLLDHVRLQTRHTWLCPCTRSLTAPGGPLVRTFVGHAAFVNAVAVLPDGKRALSASSDGTLNLWDLDTGTVLRTFAVDTGAVTAVAMLPDGKHALSASRTLKLWDLDTGVLRRTLEGHRHRVNALAVLPDGKRALSASRDRTLKLWDLENGALLRSFEGHSSSVNALAILPDGRRAVSASDELILWDLDTGTLLRSFVGHAGEANAVEVFPDGKRAISASSEPTLKVWDLETGALVRTISAPHFFPVYAVAVLDGGKVALSAAGRLRMWDLDTGALLYTLEGHADPVTALAILSDGEKVLSASWDGTLRLWDLGSRVLVRTGTERKADNVEVIAMVDATQVLCGSFHGNLMLLDLATGALLRSFAAHRDPVTAVAALPGGKRAVSTSGDGMLKVWDLDTGGLIHALLDHVGLIRSFAVLPDGRHVLYASGDTVLKLWDVDTGVLRHTLVGHSASVNAVTVLPDGKRAVSASHDRTVRLWDLEAGALLRTLVGHSDNVHAVVALPDGKRALSTSYDRTSRLWDLETGDLLHTFEGHGASENTVMLLPDGKQALVCGGGTLQLWDIETGNIRRTFEESHSSHSSGVDMVKVFPDGKHALSVSEDRTLKVWKVSSGQVLAVFVADYPISACTLASDSRIVVASDAGGYVHMLRLIEPDTGLAASTPSTHRKVEELFDRLLDLDTTERGQILDRECAGNPALRQEIDALLEHARFSTISSVPVGQAVAGIARPRLPAVGERLGRYTLLDELGSGGMGTVYLARDDRLDRRVAIKVLVDADPALARRFTFEARATARCEHENIVVVHEIDDHDGCPYMVLEYVDGQTLRQYLRGQAGPLAPVQAVALMLPVVRALAFAHSQQIIHRDLKPENIMLARSGAIKVLDFGIARILPDVYASTLQRDAGDPAALSMTRKGAILGTLPYISPEQWAGIGVDAQSDIWAVGVMLFEMVAGRHPLAPLDAARLQAVADLATPMPGAAAAGAGMHDGASGAALAALIDHCLVKRKPDRIASASELARQLAEIEGLARNAATTTSARS